MILTNFRRVSIRRENLNKGQLVLEDGSVFNGKFFGEVKTDSGEVVFNTGMVGYPEALTDPSYRGQILVLTYPLIGNYGVPGYEKDNYDLYQRFESEEIQVKGLIVSDYSFKHNHWNSEKSLREWLQNENTPALFGIDTRALTKKIREEGTMLGRIETGKSISSESKFFNPDETHLVSQISCRNFETYGSLNSGPTIVGIDCGIKNSIIRSFIERGAEFFKVPYDFDPFEENINFDGLFISNGPGDPEMNKETISVVEKALNRNIPAMGICLGNQILGLAAGGKTYKLKYGHRSQNQPVKDLKSKKCYITSQNHGFSVKHDTLPEDWTVWFKNANDETVEGIKHNNRPFYGIQFHPEASPGPTDTKFLFDTFLKEVKENG